MRCALLTLAATLAATAVADIVFTSPAAGSIHVGGASLTVTWKDDGTSPSIADLDTYVLSIIFGGTAAGTITSTKLIAGTYTGATTGSVTVVVPVTAGATSSNGYYLQMVSTSASETGTDIVYSERFGMSGMTGVMAPAVSAILATALASNVIPDAHGLVAAAAAGTTAAAADAMDWTIPYYLQTGLTKYAPMQPIPPTKITAKGTPTPLYPSSSYVIATGYLAPPSVTTTVTVSQTYTVSSVENTAAAVTNTDMKRFLARWVD